jgi:hypothetical protein
VLKLKHWRQYSLFRVAYVSLLRLIGEGVRWRYFSHQHTTPEV